MFIRMIYLIFILVLSYLICGSEVGIGYLLYFKIDQNNLLEATRLGKRRGKSVITCRTARKIKIY